MAQAKRGFDLSDYRTVAERIDEFKAHHPEGSLQPADISHPYHIEQIAGETFIVYVAAAYRSPSDHRPGIGIAWEPVPGRTPYTEGSELQNAETSAWGRAIVAALASDTRKGIASAEEIESRTHHTDPRKELKLEVLEAAFGDRTIARAWWEAVHANTSTDAEVRELLGPTMQAAKTVGDLTEWRKVMGSYGYEPTALLSQTEAEQVITIYRVPVLGG